MENQDNEINSGLVADQDSHYDVSILIKAFSIIFRKQHLHILCIYIAVLRDELLLI